MLGLVQAFQADGCAGQRLIDQQAVARCLADGVEVQQGSGFFAPAKTQKGVVRRSTRLRAKS